MILFFSKNALHGQDYNYRYRSVPEKYLRYDLYNPQVKNIGYVNIEGYLPRGYSRFGDIDYTKFIQKALDENRNVIMPNFPILINDTGLRIKSNSNIFFENNSKLILMASQKDIYHVILIKDCKNVEIHNPQIIGDRSKHRGITGEWGMGLSIYNSQDILIRNAKIKDCWGDGIYIGRNSKINNFRIKICYAQLQNNRRNGLSLISGEQIVLNDIVVSNTNGTLPMSGIVIEPNSNDDILNNITINKPITFNNRYGILIYLKALQGKKKKYTNIRIDSHTDQYSLNGVKVSEVKIEKGNEVIKSLITISNTKWKNNLHKFSIPNNQDIRVIVD